MPSVLVVDDDPDIRESLALLLSMKGYEVEQAEDGAAALDAMRAHKPAAVILDLMMPVMDGWTVRKNMLADPELAAVPTIVVSGAADLGPALGGCAVLTKPVEFDRLLETLQSCAA